MAVHLLEMDSISEAISGEVDQDRPAEDLRVVRPCLGGTAHSDFTTMMIGALSALAARR